MLCFFFRVVFNNCFTIPVVIENAKLKLVFTIPTGAPIKIAKDAMEMLLLDAGKIVSDL